MLSCSWILCWRSLLISKYSQLLQVFLQPLLESAARKQNAIEQSTVWFRVVFHPNDNCIKYHQRKQQGNQEQQHSRGTYCKQSFKSFKFCLWLIALMSIAFSSSFYNDSTKNIRGTFCSTSHAWINLCWYKAVFEASSTKKMSTYLLDLSCCYDLHRLLFSMTNIWVQWRPLWMIYLMWSAVVPWILPLVGIHDFKSIPPHYPLTAVNLPFAANRWSNIHLYF